MTQYFSQSDIDEYRECFYLYAEKGYIENWSHLRLIMRTLGYSLTTLEANAYYRAKKGKIDFAYFLEILHEHRQKGDPIKEVMNAFKSYDRQRRGYITAKELTLILSSVGEKMSKLEIDRVLREAHITDGLVRYQDFVRLIATPLPDYD